MSITQDFSYDRGILNCNLSKTKLKVSQYYSIVFKTLKEERNHLLDLFFTLLPATKLLINTIKAKETYNFCDLYSMIYLVAFDRNTVTPGFFFSFKQNNLQDLETGNRFESHLCFHYLFREPGSRYGML